MILLEKLKIKNLKNYYNMIRFTIYPRLLTSDKTKTNPYIEDYIRAIEKDNKAKVINIPHKNSITNIIFPKNWGDVFIFNWAESIPSYTYGYFQWQSMLMISLIFIIKLCNRKIIWMLHNKNPHQRGNEHITKYMMNLLAHKSTLIITHAQDGVELIKKKYPFAVDKVHFIDHPTKKRLPSHLTPYNEKTYDLIIWGNISKYKGVTDFLEFLSTNNIKRYKICIIGKCSSPELKKYIESFISKSVEYIPKEISFEELGHYIAQSNFVLTPYLSESILSSGTLMDSLSYGAKVIGPNSGSFMDYAKDDNIKVYTFRSFEDIPIIIDNFGKEEISLEKYYTFLEKNSWSHFAEYLLKYLKKDI